MRFNPEQHQTEQLPKKKQTIALDVIAQKRREVRKAMVPLETTGGIDSDQSKNLEELRTYFAVLNLFFDLAKNDEPVPETWEELGVSVDGETAKIPTPTESNDTDGETSYVEAQTPQEFLQSIGASAISDIQHLINQRMPSKTQTTYNPTATKLKDTKAKPAYDPETDPFRNIGKTTAKPKKKWPFSR